MRDRPRFMINTKKIQDFAAHSNSVHTRFSRGKFRSRECQHVHLSRRLACAKSHDLAVEIRRSKHVFLDRNITSKIKAAIYETFRISTLRI